MELLPEGRAVGLGGLEAILEPLDLLVGLVEALERLRVCKGPNEAIARVQEGSCEQEGREGPAGFVCPTQGALPGDDRIDQWAGVDKRASLPCSLTLIALFQSNIFTFGVL